MRRMLASRGALIVLEGVDRTGKTTQATMLVWDEQRPLVRNAQCLREHAKNTGRRIEGTGNCSQESAFPG